LHAGLAGERSGEFLTTPLGMTGAMLEGVLIDEAIEVLFQRAGHFGGATRAGAVHQALDPLVGEAMDPLAQSGIGKVQRVGHCLEAAPLDDVAHGLGTAKNARLLRLLQEALQGGKGIMRKVECESPHRGGLQEKLLQKFTGYIAHGSSYRNKVFSTQISLELLIVTIGVGTKVLRGVHGMGAAVR